MTKEPEDKKQKIFSDLLTALDTQGNGSVTKKQLLNTLLHNGIKRGDHRIASMVASLEDYAANEPIGLESFVEITSENIGIVERCIKGQLAIPDFKTFTAEIKKMYNAVVENESGDVATYIPQLARIDPENFAVSICTIDGQSFDIGPSDEPFCVQSTCKPINYCIAMQLNGEDYVHKHVGQEPSGLKFNEITLNRDGLPHNPMINAGAIMCSSMIMPDYPLADRFDYVMQCWKKLSGHISPGYNNAVYLSEKATADRNFALAHFMKEVGAFPNNTNIYETLDFYFQCCSIEVTSRDMAVIAATFANAGMCPKTNTQVFEGESVKNCLSLMYSCGMYDFSGEFAFSVGLPAKSGVSGAMMIVIPNVMGITIWSPRLDRMGNSVRGVEFCKQLIKTYNFHNYDSLVGQLDKIDPRLRRSEAKSDTTFSLIWAASHGDLDELRRLVAMGVNIDSCDYDGRTALHLAAAEGLVDTVKYLLAKGASTHLKDRWGNTPIADAKTGKHEEVIELLVAAKK